MTRETPQFGLRMPPELKEQMAREAQINGRSLNAEIVDRLRKSLERQGVPSGHDGTVKSPRGAPYGSEPLTDLERQLLAIARKMTPEKQLALVTLFR